MGTKKRKILIVDDEPGFTGMVKLNLEETGQYDVRIENVSTQALDTAMDYQPDLILLDVIMPDAEGPDIAYQIRANEKTKNIPVVFLTATVRKDEVDEQAGMIGGHPFLAKPGSVEELVECIERHLAERE